DAQGRPVYTEGEANYRKGDDKYIEVDRKITYEYDPKESTILPRMYSDQPNHVQRYMEVTGLRPNESPGFGDNLKFMFSHQIGHMYLRYFMWNFAGRESDIQDAGWLSPWEAAKDVPEELAENKGRNNYFMIPLILGIIGLVYQWKKDVRNFAFVGLLFILTGVALVVYLNSPPIEPRERDYIYVGSYYAFAMWIGFAVLAIADVLAKFLSKKASVIAAVIVGLVAPGLMAQQNWDDIM
ncbi:MAG: DUF2723 domain-containing protein, partial [Cyclobacteriaceae bacterium]